MPTCCCWPKKDGGDVEGIYTEPEADIIVPLKHAGNVCVGMADGDTDKLSGLLCTSCWSALQTITRL